MNNAVLFGANIFTQGGDVGAHAFSVGASETPLILIQNSQTGNQQTLTL